MADTGTKTYIAKESTANSIANALSNIPTDNVFDELTNKLSTGIPVSIGNKVKVWKSGSVSGGNAVTFTGRGLLKIFASATSGSNFCNSNVTLSVDGTSLGRLNSADYMGVFFCAEFNSSVSITSYNGAGGYCYFIIGLY